MNTKSILFIFIILLSSSLVCSVGIGQQNNEKRILFQPNLIQSYEFYLFDSRSIDASLEGDLVQYATIVDDNPGGAERMVEVKLSLPEYLEPGLHKLFIVATQGSFNGKAGTVGGIASVKTGVEVYALFPGKHPIISGVAVPDININEQTTASLSIMNGGEEDILAANGTIFIYDDQNQLRATLSTDAQEIPSFQAVQLTTILDSTKFQLTAGNYKAVGIFSYDSINTDSSLQVPFMVGEMKLNIIDSTPSMIVNATNKYFMAIQSDWSGNIDNVYAKITLPNGEIVKTANVDLIKEQGLKPTAQIETYLETKGLSVGTNELLVTLYYNGRSESKKINVEIMEGVAPKLEKPSKGAFNIMNISIGVSIVIILFLAAYFFMFRHGGNKQSSEYTKTDEIKPPSI